MKTTVDKLLGIVTVLLELMHESNKEKINQLLASISLDLIDIIRDIDELLED